MPDPISKTQRLLDLTAFLVGRRQPVTVDQILEGVPAYAAPEDADEKTLASTRRMFERDKDELRAIGIPLETVDLAINYGAEVLEAYRISRNDFYLPYLKLVGGRSAPAPGRAVTEVQLTDDEARLALDALRRVAEQPAFPFAAEARSAFRKLAFDLDPDLFRPAPVLWIDPPGTEELLARVRTLADALLARKRVSFSYRGIQRDEVTERTVHGYGLFFVRDWYLVGHDEMRDAIRVFRVGRMGRLDSNRKAPKTPDYEIPDEFRLQDFIDRDPWQLGADAEPVQAEVRFRFPASLLVEREGRGELIEEMEDGSTLRRFEVHQVEPFLRWVLSQEGDAEIVGPAELKGEMAELLAEIGAMYRTRGEDG
jgi:proteasome accessory factor B